MLENFIYSIFGRNFLPVWTTSFNFVLHSFNNTISDFSWKMKTQLSLPDKYSEFFSIQCFLIKTLPKCSTASAPCHPFQTHSTCDPSNLVCNGLFPGYNFSSEEFRDFFTLRRSRVSQTLANTVTEKWNGKNRHTRAQEVRSSLRKSTYWQKWSQKPRWSVVS